MIIQEMQLKDQSLFQVKEDGFKEIHHDYIFQGLMYGIVGGVEFPGIIKCKNGI
jgi:hypothetical protein